MTVHGVQFVGTLPGTVLSASLVVAQIRMSVVLRLEWCKQLLVHHLR